MGYYDKNLYPEVIDDIKLIHGDNLIYIDNESGSIYINYQRVKSQGVLMPDFTFNYADKTWESKLPLPQATFSWFSYNYDILDKISWIFNNRFRDFKLEKILES